MYVIWPICNIENPYTQKRTNQSDKKQSSKQTSKKNTNQIKNISKLTFLSREFI